MNKRSIIPKPVTEYDLRLLRIFVSVVEYGGFAAAEQPLGITRSTISVHMSNLETRMQLTLCRRGRGGFSLTADGQSVYRAVIELFDSLNDFSLLVSNLGKELSGDLVILCTDQLDRVKQQKLAQVIQMLHDSSSQLHIVLDGDSIANIEKQLLKEKAHIGLLPNYQHVEGLVYKTLFNEPIYLCCGQAHPFFKQVDSSISEQELAEVAAIHPGIDIDSQGREQLTKLNLAAKSYQFDMRKAMILSGRYLGFMPQSYIQQELNQGEIRIIKPSSHTYQFNLAMVSKKATREVNKVKLLIDVFSKVFELN